VRTGPPRLSVSAAVGLAVLVAFVTLGLAGWYLAAMILAPT
jgi:hypothetical protein